MKIKTTFSVARTGLIALMLFSCTGKKDQLQFKSELQSLNLQRGDITLCGSGAEQFGTVTFSQSCSEKVKSDFNLATSLLHSFEYTEAEKVFAKVIDQDPECIMAYWGAAMCNFHPLWAPPGPEELQKGSRIIALARSINKDKSSRESDYLEAISTIYDQSDVLDHRTRVLKFEKASEKLFEKYPDDKEAAIFYALALDASADPTDKTFRNQKKAGDILNSIFESAPNHPGITHYIIHNYDYPELAHLALPAARKYASIAAASAHAQHMPSHIFTRLGLWDESIQSNINSVNAAQCYAQNLKATGHWDEELHGLDYLIYAYLQKGDDVKALEQLNYLQTIKEVFPQNFKVGYSFASMPSRYALERKDWAAAAKLKLEPADFPWDKFYWEKANVNFSRSLGAVHTHNLKDAKTEFAQIQVNYDKLAEANEKYKANLVMIQLKACEAWIKLEEGQKAEAIKLMTEAADMEDATSKHPVTPGEILPARELLGDMYLQTGDFTNALKAYEEDLNRHPNRFNGLYGAGLALEKSGDRKKASQYYKQLSALASSSVNDRPQMKTVEAFIRNSSMKVEVK
jgi:tetratricopeptide (TPR) repeat protein